MSLKIWQIMVYTACHAPIDDIWLFQCKIDFLFHRMNNKSSIFTSGEAMSENTSWYSRVKSKRSFTENSQIFYFFLLKNCNNFVYSKASAFRTETQLFP